ncbi:MAG: tRNA glutamyl-Q(34) synthetase GluQRS [Gemmatimonadaceae bacterium]|nr:tRNA glutamyl-Q(34) synthetase GluQRS [Gemmatimonadaceae bacterium]
MSSSSLRAATVGHAVSVTTHRAWCASLVHTLPTAGWRTRFAPAPTGLLHLGHVVNAIFVWGLARAYGGQVALRVEDHDRTRCRPEFEREMLDDLAWLGFDADIAPIASYGADHHTHAYRQSNNDTRYDEALSRLTNQSLVFVCDCSRRAIAELTARSASGEVRYPGTCRAAQRDGAVHLGRRMLMHDGDECFTDLRLGEFRHDPSRQCGDVLIRDRHGNWTYQFAVTVDDIAHEIDVIIRGEDLLSSTGRQQRMATALGRVTPPRVLHHPLIVHDGGAKLSKANHDTSIRDRRAVGDGAPQLIGEAAYLVGLTPEPTPVSASDVADLFR